MNITFRKCILKKVTVNTQISEKKKATTKKINLKQAAGYETLTGVAFAKKINYKYINKYIYI